MAYLGGPPRFYPKIRGCCEGWVSIHKSQGSEFPVVVIPLAMQQYMLLERNLIYTGITRGKKLVVLAGEAKALGVAIRKNNTHARHSGLLARLQRFAATPAE